MIIDQLLNLAQTVLGWLMNAVPAPDVPQWLSEFDSSSITQVIGHIGWIGNFVPTTMLVAVMVAVVAAWLSGFAMKIGRVALSLFTAGGGSAA